jgi:antitoxin (DNA-binding transcriptional repressor) of toxin-antitoxin stability system
MPSITLSQLRNTRQLMAWLTAGETIELRERKRLIAHIIPVIPWPFPDENGTEEDKGKDEPLSSADSMIAHIFPVKPWPFPDEYPKPKKAGKESSAKR